jgi:hypothetical protein
MLNRSKLWTSGLMVAVTGTCLSVSACSEVPTAPENDELASPVFRPGSPPGKDKNREPAWELLQPDGAGPPSGYYLAADMDEAGNAVYACAINVDYDVSTTLWRFDLTTDSWSEIPTTGWPSGKYRQCIHDPQSDRILTYWDGIGPVYAVPVTGGSWTRVGFDGEGQSYYEAAPFWNPVTMQLMVFAGYGLGQFRNTLHVFDGTNFQVLGTTGDVPDGRFGPDLAIDAAGQTAYMAGRSLGGAGLADDLYSLDLGTGAFTRLLALGAPGTIDRVDAGMTYVPDLDALYRFGGYFVDNSGLSDALVWLDLSANPVSWESVPFASNVPSPPARLQGNLFYDGLRGRLVLVGSRDANRLTDTWAFNIVSKKPGKGPKKK